MGDTRVHIGEIEVTRCIVVGIGVLIVLCEATLALDVLV